MKKVMPATLIITHFSMRYVTKSSKEEEAEEVQISINDLLEETKNSCAKETKVLAATDLWSFEIPRKYRVPKKQLEKVPESNSNVNKQEE